MKQIFIITISSIFVVLTISILLLNKAVPAYNFPVLETGNAIMLVLSLSAFAMVNKTAGRNGAAFVRGVSGASLLKLMVCMFGVLIYAFLNRKAIHKPSIFVLMGIYALYSATETIILSKMARTMK